MDDGYYLKIPAKPLVANIQSRSATSTARPPCNWASEAQADFHRTENGRYPLLPETREKSCSFLRARAGPARFQRKALIRSTAEQAIFSPMESTSASMRVNAATKPAVTWWM